MLTTLSTLLALAAAAVFVVAKPVVIRDTPHHARVVPLPFYKRAENAPNAL